MLFLQKSYKRETTTSELKRIGADRVALIMMRDLRYKFSPPDELERLTEEIKIYKAEGFECMVWLGETFGHDPDTPIPGIPYTNMRFFDKGDISPFCPLDTNFRDDFCEWIKSIARCGADMIMMDDDYRLGHRPGGLACCCELHMQKLREELGEDFTEEEFKKKAFDGGENKYRNAWIKVCGDTMRSFSSDLRAALDTVNPKARLGFCTAPSHWDSEGADAIEIAKILAKDTKPFIRLGGAPYWCDIGTPVGKMLGSATVGEVVEYARTQASWCKGEDIETFGEGDTYPRPRFTTSAAYLECFDTILRATGEVGGILKYVLDYASSADYEHGYVDFHAKNTPLYTEIEKLFAGKRAIGLRPYNEMRLLKKRTLDINDGDTLEKIQNNLSNPAKLVALKTSLPISYEKNSVNIVFGEHAHFIDESELKNGAIIDLSAAEILMRRGIDVGIESICEKPPYVNRGFMDRPLECFPDEDQYTLLGHLLVPQFTHKSNVTVLTKFTEGDECHDAVCQYENEKGYKFVILPVCADNIPRGFLDTYARRRQLVKSLAWLRGKPLPVDVCGNHPMLYTVMKENDNGIALGLWNIFQDKIENLKLSVNTEYKSVRFVNCSGKTEGNEIVLDGTLYPYEFAGLEIVLK